MLRLAALTVVLITAGGSIALMLRAGRNAPAILLTMFVVWVLSPYAALVTGVLSSRQKAMPQPFLDGIALVIALGSFMIYIVLSYNQPQRQGAFLWLVVPGASWLLIGIALVLARVLGWPQRARRGIGGLPTSSAPAFTTTSGVRRRRRLYRGAGALAAVPLVVGFGLVAYAFLERRTPLTLPAPTGPFGVGRTIEVWADNTAPRELLVWIWYPAKPPAAESAATGDYVPREMQAAWTPRGLMGLMTRDLSKVRAHAVGDADVSSAARAYPVLIMRAGASAGVANYSSLAENLASHGYVVVGFDAPGRTNAVVFPGGRVLRRNNESNPERCGGPKRRDCLNAILAAWTRDMSFVLDRLGGINVASAGRFAGRLDLTRVGVFGHSLGGAAAAEFCHQDVRCKAAADVDGALLGSVVHGTPRYPLMFVLSDHDGSSDVENRQIQADIDSLYARLSPARRILVVVRGATHFTFSDDGALLKSGVVRGAMRLFGELRIEGDRQLAATSHCLRTFFDASLKDATGIRPEVASALYPEIEVRQ